MTLPSDGVSPIAFGVMDAPPAWRCIDFISDLHLSALTPRTFDAWAAHLLNTPADAVFMLGDVFEVWVGDDARLEAHGFEHRCLAVLQQASSQRCIGFMAGNRDFLLGPDMANDAGLMALPDPLLLRAWGQSLMLSHGDALCLADTAYQRFRTEVRSAGWQSDFLARPLAGRRAIARELRARSERAHAEGHNDLWADLDTNACTALLRAARCPTLLHGHTHRPARHTLSPQMQRWVLSDWDLDVNDVNADAGAVAVANASAPEAPRADVIRWTATGLHRVAPATGPLTSRTRV